MKNIITSIFVFLSLNLSAQNLDYKDINFNMLDSLVLEEVNQRRKDLGVSIIHYSKVIHEMVSKEQTRILLTEERVYHPNKKSLYDKILLDLKKECYDNHYIVIDTSRISTTRQTEVSIMLPNNYEIKTYEELSKYFVDVWISSYAHKGIIMGYGESSKLNPGAVSIQPGYYDGYPCLYGTFQIVKPIYN
jgi:hypothetical protein